MPTPPFDLKSDRASPAAHQLSSITVLIIEDNPADVRLIKETLAEADHASFELVWANRLSAGLERLAQGDIDIVLLDLGLPDSQELEAIPKIQQQAPAIPIVVLTVSDEKRFSSKTMQLGVQDYLVKGNIDPHILTRTIRYAIERHRLVIDLEQKMRALQSSEARFRRIIENNADGIVIVDEQGRIRFINPAAELLFGRSAETLVGEMFEFPVVTGENTEIDIVQPEGKTLVAEIRAEATSWEGETVLLVSLRDITDRQQLEEQLRQSQKMEAVGKLAGGVAHDFNNLLTVITGYSELLLKRTPDDQEAHRKDIEQIKKASQRAASLTRQLLAFSRKQMLQPKVLNLNQIVADLGKMLRRLIGEDVELVTVLTPELGLVKADPSQIEQVIMNLVINARDAMPQGGRLTVETRNIHLDKGYARRYVDVEPGPYVLLATSDTGHGMTPEIRDRIFEPFFTTKEQGKGTGLGLATVHGIIKQSGGHIWVYSEPGQGTTFEIYLPQIEETDAAVRSSQAMIPSAEGSEIILLVEDEDLVRELAARILTRGGYRVLTASSGADALEVSQHHAGPINLLVTDIVMPGGMNGRDLAKRLTVSHPDLKVLYMSGYTDDAIVHHGILDSDVAFLEKPFTPDVLLLRVHEMLYGS
jgi:signal transduction histidine kinase